MLRNQTSRGQDVMLLKHNDYKDFFFSQRTWDQIRTRGPKVRWHSLVWFTQGVPRLSFIVWLAFRDRLSTRIRKRSWGITQGCMLCGEREKQGSHLLCMPFHFHYLDNTHCQFIGIFSITRLGDNSNIYVEAETQ